MKYFFMRLQHRLTGTGISKDCPNGHLNLLEYPYCSECGAKTIKVKKPTCPRCGWLTFGYLFCQECGFQLQPSLEQEGGKDRG